MRIEVQPSPTQADSEINAKTIANLLQTAAVQEQIRLFQDQHPGEQAPPYLRDQLAALSTEMRLLSGQPLPVETQPPPGGTSAAAPVGAENSMPVINDSAAGPVTPNHGGGGLGTAGGAGAPERGGGGAETVARNADAVANPNQGAAVMQPLSEDNQALHVVPGSFGEMVSQVCAADAGKALWSDWEQQHRQVGVTHNGEEGCAASVSEVFRQLEQLGVHIHLDSTGVIDLSNQAKASGWSESRGLENVQAGSIIYGDNGYPDQHIGIVAEQNGKLVVFNNINGRWQSEPLTTNPYEAGYKDWVGRFGNNLHVLNPPEQIASAQHG